ncbi:MAG: SprB repeat-containing protein [Bacteroidetes bacterium]|nr:SprB repeat-containing protein [Bacteroidota bacterium]
MADSISDVKCNGDSNGYLSVIVNGGTPPFSYLWSNGSTLLDINNVTSGVYTVTVTDTNGCSGVNSFIIVQPSNLGLIFNSVTNVDCNGLNTGGITVLIGGGVQPYSFLWSNSATTQNLNNVGAGSYSITVIDVNNCSATFDTIITQPLILSANLASKANVLCYGDSSGTLSTNIGGGKPPYSYLWSNGNTNQNMIGLIVGIYTLIVTDVNGCTTNFNESILGPDSLSFQFTTGQPSCGLNNGFINATVLGGTPPYLYLWSNGITLNSINNLASGTYTLTVTDSTGCTDTAEVNLFNQNGPSIIVDSITDALCTNGNGAGYISIANGASPYSFIWNNGNTTEDLLNVPSGSYTVTVTDAASCTASISITIGINNPLQIQFTVNDAQCNASNGSVSTNILNGTSPLQYLWSNGSTNDSLANIPAGTYILTVTDASGCSISDTVVVNATSGINATIQVNSNVLCFGGNNGSMSAFGAGGAVPYTYLWSNSNTNQNIVTLIAGTYTVTVTDANNCTATSSAIISQPSEIIIITGSVNSICGQQNGSATANASGRVGNLTYLWSNGSTLNSTGLVGSGFYIVTVTDVTNCTKTAVVTVANTGGPVASVIGFTNASCYGSNTGSISISITGGTAPYDILWSNGTTNSVVNNIPAGTYTVTVTDDNNCFSVISQLISQPDSIEITTTIVPTKCTDNNGSITASAIGGVGSLSFLWSTASTAQTISNLVSGTYTVTVTDQNACTVSKVVVVPFLSPHN